MCVFVCACVYVCVDDIKLKVELFPYRFIFIPSNPCFIHSTRSIVGDFHFRVLDFIQINSTVLLLVSDAHVAPFR